MRLLWTSIAVFCGFLLTGVVATLAAQKAIEVVRPRGLLLMGPIDQSVSLRYEYYGHDTDTSTSSTNRFKERYTLITEAAVWDPELLRINLQLDFWLEQQKDRYDPGSSRTSDSSKMTYRLAATAFENRPYPIVVRSSLEETDVNYSYTPSYSLTTTRNSITAKYLNKVAPIRFHYQHLNSESSGRARDTSVTTDLTHFSIVNNYRDISHTQFDATWLKQEQETEGAGETDPDIKNDSDIKTFSLSNGLYLDRQRLYSLGTAIQWQDANMDDGDHESLDITEDVLAHFGKALTGEAVYKYEFDKMPGFNDEDQELTKNSLDLSLTHLLYESLETRLDTYLSDTELNGGGKETEARTGLWFNYRKKLPQASMLQVNVGGSHQKTERDFGVLQIRVKRQFVDVNRGDSIDLDVTGGTLDTVEKMEKIDGQGREIIDPLGNYTVNYAFARIDIELIAPDFPAPDDTGIAVEVTYVINVSRSPLEYTTDIFSLSSNVSLYEGRYQIMARYYQEDQTLQSGEVGGGSLPDLTEVEVRFDARINYHRFGLEYSSYDSGSNSYQYLEGEWYYTRPFPPGTLQLQARNRYTKYEVSGTNKSDYDVNDLTLGATYSRRLTSWANVVVSLNYANSSGDNISRDAVYARTALWGRINQLDLSLTATTMLRMNEDDTFRDDFIGIEITRRF